MGYWWVNHKQTYREEIGGGYVWSPKKKANGGFNQTYENLRLVRPGDRVFSYAAGEIRAVGIAIAGYRDAPKPSEFGSAGDAWSDLGWLVPIEWQMLQVPLAPKQRIEQIAPLLPARHSPIQANGNGNQGCYLASISQTLGELLLSLAGLDTTSGPTDDEAEVHILQADIPETTRQQLIQARRGQGLFRANVKALGASCPVTGVTLPEFLVASHIKPWRLSSNEERLDGHNGLMLSPHIDRLFDGGWISFADDGSLIVASPDITPVLQAWGVPLTLRIAEQPQLRLPYLRYHRERIFKRG